MKKLNLLFLLIAITGLGSCNYFVQQGEEKQTYPSLTLWYEKPANIWDEALPVGNGRMGAMVFGNVYNERIQINEESLWAGKRFNNNNQNALKDLPKMRQLIFDGNINEAYNLGNKSLLSTPPRFRSYQTFGDIFLSFDSLANYSGYRRELNLSTGISKISYRINEINFTREVFVSAPNNTIVINITADKPGSISTEVCLQRQIDAQVHAKNNQLILQGQIRDETTDEQGAGGENMKFAAKMIAIHKGGKITAKEGKLIITDADELTLIFTAATDYNLDKLDYDRSIDPLLICRNILDKSVGKSYDQIKEAHINDHSLFFNRVQIDFGGGQLASLPTDVRLDSVKNGGNDPALIALYFQYGRYLLMGSSRSPGVLPANLQGIWNSHIKAPWNSDYHTNINLQMNYWLAEVCNLHEMTIPLVNLVDKWREPGRVSAGDMYGCSGWMMHHATDIFGKTAPNADMRWGMSPLSGVWMTFPLWRHYEFTMDKEYLKSSAYPIMREAMEFVSDFLIEKDGYLVTNPTMSPENAYILKDKRHPKQLTYASTIDNQTLMAHIDHCIEAGEILGIDDDLRKNWKQIRSKIPPVSIGKDSTIMEWIKDYDEWEPGHRHMSHLLGLYPLAQITPETPDLFEAANKTIEKRLKYGGGHTGWSRAWMINFFARLQQPETAYEHVMALLRKSTKNNLFDNHPPFQIDGNFGGTAGIAEMLLQSHLRDVNGNYYQDILPALPSALSTGKISGIKGRGGFEISISWENGNLVSVKVISLHGGKLNLRYHDQIISEETTAGKTYSYLLTDFTSS
ncbi:MAG: glycoside hydrolase family 95 protein [Bacteroidota bacterium]|nr:glycoside hydrolase family 95 protein [Bacteroidota bacterium]